MEHTERPASPTKSAEITHGAVARERPKPAANPRDARQSRFAQAFANVVAVMMRDPGFRKLRLADLEWLALPPIMAGQWRLVQAPVQTGQTGSGAAVMAPMGVVLWARVSSEIDKRLTTELDKPVFLQPNQWVSGDHIWIVAAAGDQRLLPGFLRNLAETEFEGMTVKMRAHDREGKPTIITIDDYLATEIKKKSGHRLS